MERMFLLFSVIAALIMHVDAFRAGVSRRIVASSRMRMAVAHQAQPESTSALFATAATPEKSSPRGSPLNTVKSFLCALKSKIVALYAAILSFISDKAAATKKMMGMGKSSAEKGATNTPTAPSMKISSKSTPSPSEKALQAARRYAADKLKEIDESIRSTTIKEAEETDVNAEPITISTETLKALEAEPYYDQSNIPMQTYKAKEPYVGKVVSVKRIVGAQATGETCDIVIDHKGKMPYWEGQSYGVIPPGINPKNNKPYTNRLYSIASSRYGDDMKGTTTTLCVRRATYWCPELKAEDPAKKGVCSNFLCDAKPGDSVSLTGPSGKVMLLPEKTPEADIIMVATGTGIAPYRSFWKRLFIENTPAAEAFKGQAWLFLGVANTDALLYDDELQMIKKKNPEQFRLDYALSREQTNKDGGKMYIQDKVEEYADEIFAKLDNGAHMYFCGLKGMMPGILAMLEKVATGKGLVWKEQLKEWKEKGQWHVEVY